MHAESRGARFGAVLWVVGLQIFLVEYLAQRAFVPSYSLTHDYVSNLGVLYCNAQMCSPLHAWFNISFLVQGVLLLGGVALLRRSYPPLPESSAGLAFLAIAGTAVMMAALAPADIHYYRHLFAGGMFFVSGSIAIWMFGLVLLNGSSHNALEGWSSIAIAALTSFATLMMNCRHMREFPILTKNIGLVERVPAYGIPLWVAAMGIKMLVRPAVDSQGGLSTTQRAVTDECGPSL